MQQNHIPTEFVAGHAGSRVTAALANIIRCAQFARTDIGGLIACSTPSWRDTTHLAGDDAFALHAQIGGSWQTWTPIARNYVAIPKGCERLTARVFVAVPPSAGVTVIRPRISVDIGSGTVRRSSVRTLACADLTVATNVATCTLDKGHGILPNQTVYTSGFTANLTESSAATVREVSETTITFPLTSADGSKGSGTVYVPAEVVCDTTEAYQNTRFNEPTPWIVRHNPTRAKPEQVDVGYYLPADSTPYAVDVSVALDPSDTTSDVVCDLRVDLRARWDVVGTYVPGVPVSVAQRIVPLGVLVYADVGENAYGMTSLEWSAGEPITEALCTKVNQEVTSAITRPLTHTNAVFGGFGAAAWDNYPTLSDASQAGGSIGSDVRPNEGTAATVTLYLGEVYLDWATDLQVGFTYHISDDTTTWTVDVDIGGASDSVTGLTGDGKAAETTATVSAVPAGWQSVVVTATQTAGSNTYFDLRHLRITEVGSTGQPADD